MYHDVYDKSKTESGINLDSNYPYKISKSTFEEQVKAIADYINKNGINKDYIRLSFDDGGVSFYTIVQIYGNFPT